MGDWKTSGTAPDGKTVMTKIDDAAGCRNEHALRRSGNLWFVPDGSMYVYYRPTHWRPLTFDERNAEAAKLNREGLTAASVVRRAMDALTQESPADERERRGS